MVLDLSHAVDVYGDWVDAAGRFLISGFSYNSINCKADTAAKDNGGKNRAGPSKSHAKRGSAEERNNDGEEREDIAI